MLVIRMQRVGRKGLAQYRVIVQDSRQTPTSGKTVASLGAYDPHTKQHSVDIEKATEFMNNGAQPSPRVAKLLSDNGVKLPSWVKVDTTKSAKLKNADKLRKNQPAEEPAEEAEDAPADEPATEEAPKAEEPAGEGEEAPAETEEK